MYTNEYDDLESISHIVSHAHEIAEFVEDVSWKTFSESRMLQSAVFFNVVVIGEASGRLSSSFRENHTHIPWRDIVNMRNFLVHVYDQINPRIVWSTIQKDIPQLIAELEPLLPFSREQ